MGFENIFEEVKSYYDIVDVISSFVKLKKVGRNYVGLCPFHSESKPSFVVNPEKQIFKCFGCGVGGDVVTFYMKIKGLSFKEALLELAERAGIQIDKNYFKEKKRENELVEFNYKIAKFYNYLLEFHSDSKIAKEYLLKRGLSEETVKTFLIGFAPSEGRVLASYVRSSGEELKKAEEVGLVKKTSDGSYVDLFRGRIIFPIFNNRGECIGFGARALSPDQEPKYLNTPETKVYKKSEILYGLYHAKDFIKKEDEGVLVEGYFDFLSLWEKGIKNVVATCGPALTEKHVQILKRLTENWIIFYDGDSAGRKATLRAFSLFLKEGIVPRCALLPEGEDPDSWARKFESSESSIKTALKEILKDGVEFTFEFYQGEYPDNPSKAFKEVIEVFKNVEDPILKKELVKKVSEYFEVPEADVLKFFLSGSQNFSALQEIPVPSSLDSASQEKKESLKLKIIAQFLLNYPEYFSELEEAGFLKFVKELEESPYSRFLNFLVDELKRGNVSFEFVPDPEFQEILSELIFTPPFEEEKEVLIQIKTFIKKELKKKELKKIIEEIKNLEKKGEKEEIEKQLWMLKNFLSFKEDEILRK